MSNHSAREILTPSLSLWTFFFGTHTRVKKPLAYSHTETGLCTRKKKQQQLLTTFRNFGKRSEKSRRRKEETKKYIDKQ